MPIIIDLVKAWHVVQGLNWGTSGGEIRDRMLWDRMLYKSLMKLPAVFPHSIMWLDNRSAPCGRVVVFIPCLCFCFIKWIFWDKDPPNAVIVVCDIPAGIVIGSLAFYECHRYGVIISRKFGNRICRCQGLLVSASVVQLGVDLISRKHEGGGEYSKINQVLVAVYSALQLG